MDFLKKISLLLIILFPFVSSGQLIDDNNSNLLSDRLYIEGGLGLQFGTYTFIDISPRVGYKVFDEWAIGIGGKYQYLSTEFYGENFETSTYGGSLFTTYFISDDFFAHAEYEILDGEWQIGRERYTLESFFIGGGYRISLGGNAYTSVTALYNLIDNEFTPYRNPIFRVGFGVGL